MERFPRILIEARLWTHHKLVRLGDLLGRNPTEAGGYLVRLWSWTAEYRPSGSLEGLTDREVSSAAGWRGDPAKLLTALRKSGWLKSMQVHDWQENQGKFFDKMIRERARKRRGRSADAPRGGPSDGSGSGSGSVEGYVDGSHSAPPDMLALPSTPPKQPQTAIAVLLARCDEQSVLGGLECRRRIEAWLAQGRSPADIEAILMMPSSRGRDIKALHWEYFEKRNGPAKTVAEMVAKLPPPKKQT